MIQTLLAIFIFCVVLFFYLHIYFHLKTSDDLEVYEVYCPSKEKLEEICDLRQPVIFDYTNYDYSNQYGPGEDLQTFCKSIDIEGITRSYGAFDVKIKNVKDKTSNDSEPHVPLTLASALQLMKTDGSAKLISEKNIDFLEETSLIKQFQYSDDFLRPHLVSNCDYDYTFASEGLETQLQYSCCYRNYYMPVRGKIKIILIPPKSTKYLYAKSEYETFEFLSPVSPWNVQENYKADYAKIKTLEVEVVPGKIIFIPAYWWYSIKYLNEATLCCFRYRTYMNTVAILPSLFLHFLQRQNVKRTTVKQVNMSNSNSSNNTNINNNNTDIDTGNSSNNDNDNSNRNNNSNSNSTVNNNDNGAEITTSDISDAPSGTLNPVISIDNLASESDTTRIFL
jgi:hypothetical protein